MNIPQRLTQLEAVNLIISTIGESPINTLSGSLTTDVAVAKTILNEENRKVQSIGWHFNTEEDYPLSPDSITGKIAIPTNVVRVDADKTAYDVTTRWDGSQQVLYDRKEHSMSFNTTIKADMVHIWNFEEIPEPAKWYIAIKAARVFQNRLIGDETLYRYTKEDEQEALEMLEQFESETADYSLFDNYDSYSIIER